MAQQTFNSTEVTNAQVQERTEVYKLYQNYTDMWSWAKAWPKEKVNASGTKVPIQLWPNPSFSGGTGNNDAYATAQAGNYDNFNVTYVNYNQALIETVAGVLNANANTSEDMTRLEERTSAEQFAKWLNQYISRGDSTMAIATVSSNYSGGSPTVAVCNGSTDSIGTSQTPINVYGYFYDATGATQRTGTVGAGVLQVASRSATSLTFTSNIPSDVVATDIFVPQLGGMTDASAGMYGLPIIVDSTGTYYGKSRSSYNGLASYEKTSAGSLTAGMLYETYMAVVQRGGWFKGDGGTNLDASLYMVLNTGNQATYYGLSLNAGVLTSSPQTFMHTGTRPQNDIGMQGVDVTWFGCPIKVGNDIRGDEIYFLGRDELRTAILKDVGQVDSRFPAGAANGLQSISSAGAYQQARIKFMDFFGNVFAPKPYRLGKISGLTLNTITQKATMVTG